MGVYRLKIENVQYSLNDIRHYFIDNYPNTIHLYLIGNWYKVYNEDAELISSIFHYKLFDDSYSPYLGNVCCGFPHVVLDKIKKKLKELEINFNIVDTSDYTYEYYDYEHRNNYKMYYDDIYEVEEEAPTDNRAHFKSDLYVEVGDTVSVCNIKTNERETYTITPTYHTQKPIGFSLERGNNFGRTIYKDELLNGSDLENGIILSESDLAKKLLGTYLNSTVLLIDDNLEECKYKIIDIKKH